MVRSYLRAHTVNVYAKPTDRADGIQWLKQVQRVPYTKHGFDNYMVDNVCLKGYSDTRDGAEACVFLGDTCY